MKKRIIALLLCMLAAAALASCSQKTAEFKEINTNKVAGVSFVGGADAVGNTRELCEAYNASELVGAADEDTSYTAYGMIFEYTVDSTVFNVFHIEDDEFYVSGTEIETPYIIRSEKLAELYQEAMDPSPEFFEIEDEVMEVSFVKYPEYEVDTETVAKAYNGAKLIGNAKDVEGTNEIMIITAEEYAISLSYLGEDRFLVSGSAVAVPYVAESAELAEIYNKAGE